MTVYGILGELSDAQLQDALDGDFGRGVGTQAFTNGLFGKNQERRTLSVATHPLLVIAGSRKAPWRDARCWR